MNNEACEKLYEAYYMRVFSYAMTMAGDRHLAEEITQETFSEEAVSREKGVEQAAVERDASFRVHMALHALEEPYREVFELRVFGELSFQQIGRIFGKTENWARVTFHRSRAKLKERMEEA